MTWDPLPQPAVRELQAALDELEKVQSTALREAHERITKAADKLRQRLQVVCLGGDEGGNGNG